MRARNIKPGFWKNETLGTLDPFVGLTFIGLWGLADRDGRLEDRPIRIKGELYPYRDARDVNSDLSELQKHGFIYRYLADGKSYIQIINFQLHQNPHHTERSMNYPCFTVNSRKPGESTLDNVMLTDSDVLNHESCIMNHETCSMNHDSSAITLPAPPPPSPETQTPKQPPDEPPEPKPPSALEQFVADWNEAADRAGWPPIRKMTDARKNQFRLRSKDEFWIGHYREALAKADRIPGLCGRNDREWRMDVDFFLRPDTVAKIVEGKYDNWGTGKPKAETPRRGFENIDERIARQLAEALEYHAGQNQEALQNGETDTEIPAIKYGT